MIIWWLIRRNEVIGMDDFDKYLAKRLENPEFKAEWDAHELEFQVKMMILEARSELNVTQAELAERTGIRQSNISRIEKGQATPSITTLARIAKGLGKRLQINFA